MTIAGTILYGKTLSGVPLRNFTSSKYEAIRTVVLNESFNAADTTVFSDDFDRVDPAPWVSVTSGIISIESDTLRVENGAATAGFADVLHTVEVGKWYKVSVASNNTLGGQIGRFRIGTVLGGTQYLANTSITPAGSTGTYTFKATSTDLYIGVGRASGAIGQFSYFNNVTIGEVNALAGWESNTGALLRVDAGQLVVTNPDPSVGQGRATKSFTTIIGESYILHGNSLNTSTVRIGNTAGDDSIVNQTSVGEWAYSFVATATTTFISLGSNSATAGIERRFNFATVDQSIVANGTFDDGAGWILGAGWSVAGGVAVSDGTQGARANISRDITTVIGRTYAISYTLVTRVAGSGLSAYAQGTGLTTEEETVPGTFTRYFVAVAATTRIGMRSGTTFNGTGDNVIVQEVNLV